jgi:hypothetical protein
MKIEIIGGTKEWQDALLGKLADEIDPKGVLSTGVSATRPTNAEIANKRALWDEYIDPDGHTDDDAWRDSTVKERLAEIEKMFGKD